MTEEDENIYTGKNKSILIKMTWLSAWLAAIILIYLFPVVAGKALGFLSIIGYVVYCAIPKPPKTKTSHTTTIKRG